MPSFASSLLWKTFKKYDKTVMQHANSPSGPRNSSEQCRTVSPSTSNHVRCVCFFFYLHVTPLNPVGVPSPLVPNRLVSSTVSWSGKKLLKAPCCCIAFINYTPEPQLFISTSAVYLCLKPSPCPKWTIQHDTTATALQTLRFLNPLFFFIWFFLFGIIRKVS